MRGTTIYLPGRIRPASKIALKRHKKQMLSLIWLHTASIVCCTSFNQNFRLGTTIYLPSQIQPVEFDWPQKQLKKAQKTNAEPDMATYWFNSMIYKYFITN